MVAYQGAKMSKSLGNLVFVSRLRAAGVDPMAIRLALLAHHYRSDWEWTDEELAQAQARLDRWRAAVAVTAAPAAPTAADVLATVRERLADDLDAPGALAAIDAWADAALASAATPTARPGTRRLSATPLTRCSAWPCNLARRYQPSAIPSSNTFLSLWISGPLSTDPSPAFIFDPLRRTLFP